MMHCDVVTLFPQMFEALTDYGVTGRAVKRGLVNVNCINPRDFTEDVHRTVDDRPFGGGPGMIMKMAPLDKACQSIVAKLDAGQLSAGQSEKKPRVIYFSPQGKPLTQSMAQAFSEESHLILIAGRYEGVDERFIEKWVTDEISLGDYILTGGELPAMVFLDSVIRLRPNVLGHVDSADQDSFSEQLHGLLDCPHYTRPEHYEGREVPKVLLSGNHEKIRQWRQKLSLERTLVRRPDLIDSIDGLDHTMDESTLLTSLESRAIQAREKD